MAACNGDGLVRCERMTALELELSRSGMHNAFLYSCNVHQYQKRVVSETK